MNSIRLIIPLQLNGAPGTSFPGAPSSFMQQIRQFFYILLQVFISVCLCVLVVSDLGRRRAVSVVFHKASEPRAGNLLMFAASAVIFRSRFDVILEFHEIFTCRVIPDNELIHFFDHWTYRNVGTFLLIILGRICEVIESSEQSDHFPVFVSQDAVAVVLVVHCQFRNAVIVKIDQGKFHF